MWNRDSERLSQNYLIILCFPGTVLSATKIFLQISCLASYENCHQEYPAPVL